MSNKQIMYQFSVFKITLTKLACDSLIDRGHCENRKVYATYLSLIIDIQNKLHTRFYATSVRKAHYLLVIYLLKSSSTFPSTPPPPPTRGERKGKGRTIILAAR